MSAPESASLRDTTLLDVLTLQAGYNTTVVVLGATLLGVAAGLVGVFALLRKRSLMSDALSHATLPGLGAAFLLAHALGADGRSLPWLLVGATVTSLLAVGCIQALVRWTRLREDASIGLILGVFFGAGVVLLSVVQTVRTGRAAGLDHFLLGQTAAMVSDDAMLLAAAAAVAALVAVALHKECALACFDEGFAQVQGWPVSRLDLVMMALVVLVIVVGARTVGLLLVVAMLIIPPVAARFWTERLGILLAVSAGLGGLSGYLGAAASALAPRQPAGAVIVLVAGGLCAVSLLVAPERGVAAHLARRLRLQLRIARDHVLEEAWVLEDETGDVALSRATLVARTAPVLGRSTWRGLIWLWLRMRGDLGCDAETVRLTTKGRAAGIRIRRNHRLWEAYLVRYADVAPNHVDWSVDQVEHVLSDELIAELEARLGDTVTEART